MTCRKILLVYHFFHPDEVISARLFSDLAEHLAQQGYQVTVFTGNHLIRGSQKLVKNEKWGQVFIHRFSRPGFKQSSNIGRLLNSAILQLKWLRGFWRCGHKFDVAIIGTDPQFSYMMFPFLHLMNRKIRLIHWAFDIYPEAIMVNFPFWMKLLAKLAMPFASWAYRYVDDMVDIGSCMRRRLQKHHIRSRCATLPPWALVELKQIPAADPATRRELFGDAAIGLLYSGTVGQAHNLQPFIELARACRRAQLDVAFCFAGYGTQYQPQTAQITPEDTNIRLAGFASEAELGKRLAAADIHLISLRPDWDGIVVPSKFFGALAMGRPVLFSGPRSSCLYNWIHENRIGEQLGDTTLAWLKILATQPAELAELRQRAFSAYDRLFSRRVTLKKWENLIADHWE